MSWKFCESKLSWADVRHYRAIWLRRSWKKTRKFSHVSRCLTDYRIECLNILKFCGYNIYHQGQLERNYIFCKHSVFVYFVLTSDKQRLPSYTILTGLYNRDCVYCVVRTESLNIIHVNVCLWRVNNVQVCKVNPLSNVFGVTVYFVLLQSASIYIRHCTLRNKSTK
jgi:hypothetical protein